MYIDRLSDICFLTDLLDVFIFFRSFIQLFKNTHLACAYLLLMLKKSLKFFLVTTENELAVEAEAREVAAVRVHVTSRYS